MRRLNARIGKIISLAAMLAIVALPANHTALAADGGAQAKITINFWFWGESNVTGANKWMKETIGLFEKAHPNIQVNLDV